MRHQKVFLKYYSQVTQVTELQEVHTIVFIVRFFYIFEKWICLVQCLYVRVLALKRSERGQNFGNFLLNTETYLRQRHKVDFKKFTEMCSAGDISWISNDS